MVIFLKLAKLYDVLSRMHKTIVSGFLTGFLLHAVAKASLMGR